MDVWNRKKHKDSSNVRESRNSLQTVCMQTEDQKVSMYNVLKGYKFNRRGTNKYLACS